MLSSMTNFQLSTGNSFCSLQKPHWVLACSAGESLRQVRTSCVWDLAFWVSGLLTYLLTHLLQGVRIVRGHERWQPCWGFGGLHRWCSHLRAAVRPSSKSVGAYVQSGESRLADGLWNTRGNKKNNTPEILMLKHACSHSKRTKAKSPHMVSGILIS